MAVKFLYQGHVDTTDDIKDLIVSKIKEMEVRVQKMDAQELKDFQLRDRGIHALSKHKLLEESDRDGFVYDWLKKSIELEFDESILVWHIATELCYCLDYGWPDSTKEPERNNQSPVKEKFLMGLHLSRYMIYLQYMCSSMLPARFGSIKFRDIYKEPSKPFDLPKFAQNRPACGRNRRQRKHDISEEAEIAKARKKLLDQIHDLAKWDESEEDQVKSVLRKGCYVARELQRVLRGWRWEAISEVWVEILMYAANKCKARDHAQHMRGGGELITHVWLLMANCGLTDSFQKKRGLPPTIAEIIVNPW